ncbi:complement factor B-like isoform X1 [Trichomycterus rosablanca]|uniref:complement factor B-like isoform X1 n=1 Tax=Trichomycterus rosablanca TaxID=2290929 RepID=UPI002F359D27
MEILDFWNIFILVMVHICPVIMGDSQCPKDNIAMKGGSYDFSNNGSILNYICPEGYYPDPLRKRVCKGVKWNPTTKKILECKKVTCPDPRVLQNGDVHPYQRWYFVNDTITSKCSTGYTFRGSEKRVCKVNGKWSGRTPVCSSSSDHCPDPGTPPGASRTSSSFNIDDKVDYSCNGKLKLVGSKKRVCQDNGEWSGEEPVCYAEFTYDTPEEVAEAFGGSLKASLSIHEEAGQYEKSIRVDTGGNLDIYIALDASDSIDEEDFNQAKKVVLTLMDKISYYEESPNYEIIIFATNVTKIISMTDFKTNKEKALAEVIEKLKKFKFVVKKGNSGTNIAGAYKAILYSIAFEKARNGFNPETQHVVIMFTDGSYNMGGDPKNYVKNIKETVYNGTAKREKYLDLYVFGVGAYVNVEEDVDMNKWVTKRDKEKHFFIIPDMTKMQQTLDHIIDERTKVGLCGLYKNYDDEEEFKRLAYPWLTKIIVTNMDGSLRNCIGSLVTPKFILTAAHCFRREEEPLKIYIEATDAKENKILKAMRHIPHPRYNPQQKVKEGISEYYEYDVALIELEQGVTLSKQIRPICIPCTVETSAALKLPSQDVTCKQHEELLMKEKYVDAFFMSLKNPKKQKKNVQIKQEDKKKECVEIAGKALNITDKAAEELLNDNFLCTGGSGPKSVDDNPCPGDSGGATFVSHTYRLFQLGVVSWSSSKECPPLNKRQTRDFHTNLFNPKIREFLKEHLGDEKIDAPLHFL